MTFWSERQHTARKVHQCDECQTEIAPGTAYTRGAGIIAVAPLNALRAIPAQQDEKP